MFKFEFESINIRGEDEFSGQCVPNWDNTVREKKFAYVILCQRYSQFEWVTTQVCIRIEGEEIIEIEAGVMFNNVEA